MAARRQPRTNLSFAKRAVAIGLIEQPIESVHPKDLKFYLETLARECDRLEYILTGADRQ